MTMINSIAYLPPGFLMVLLAFPAAFIPHHYRQAFLLLIIAISSFLLTAGAGVHWVTEVAGFKLILNRADNLTLPLAIVFHIAAAL
ncbi:MAG: Na(+)/H(+) antiporter subunit D, partial [Candidatus Puniceispirillum sp.]